MRRLLSLFQKSSQDRKTVSISNSACRIDPFILENGLKKHRLSLHYALCKNLGLPSVKLFWSETFGLVSN